MYKNVLIVELAFQVISAIISRSEIVGFVFFFWWWEERGLHQQNVYYPILFLLYCIILRALKP